MQSFSSSMIHPIVCIFLYQRNEPIRNPVMTIYRVPEVWNVKHPEIRKHVSVNKTIRPLKDGV